VRGERLRVGARELELERQEQLLARERSLEQRAAQLLEQHALVRGVLVEQDEPALVLEHQIETERLAQIAQLGERERRGRRRVRLTRLLGREPAAEEAAREWEVRGVGRGGARRAREHRARCGRRPRAAAHGGADRAAQQVRHRARVAEAHLPLRRVHVHVDELRVDLQEHDGDRVAAGRQRVAVGIAHCELQQPVAHGPAVHVQVQVAGPRAEDVRGAREAAHGQARLGGVEGQQRRARVGRQHRDHPLARVGRRQEQERALAVALELETDVGSDQRHALEPAGDVTRLGRGALQELAPCRHLTEQLGDLERRALGARHGADPSDSGTLPHQLRAQRFALPARAHAHARDRSDARQRLAPEAERADALQVARFPDLAGGVAQERPLRVAARHAAAVVLHRDLVQPAAADGDANLCRPGVQRVLDQLLHDRRRALDHLARGDLVHELVGQEPHFGHRRPKVSCARKRPNRR